MSKLKLLRNLRNMTQQQLSRKSGVSQAYINELENGRKANPSIGIISKLAFALGVSVKELFDDGLTSA
jgi:transcriptional regulator with XRE-family HTH domain